MPSFARRPFVCSLVAVLRERSQVWSKSGHLFQQQKESYVRLTLGMVSIDPFDMRVLMQCRAEAVEAEEDRAQLQHRQASAAQILPILEDHHLLLVTLLLLNSLANEALPIFLDGLVPIVC